ncbi:DUF2993 domain-containing protein [Streptacidiphilus sp. P02-A3a]|uniref:LmeA family phospholipid-binding protein n=1 Tax=Streptacidiphilus sp. P02-A3a TaxID=2704468 RepID=UPI0015FE2377|nr:DUF2993 domain-containing protein [Streptacidiphilus sp. P02-A3a]QMU73137.1 DUF2993 domain-containing protein [Streptacidiphilus sp. P02-A3a]
MRAARRLLITLIVLFGLFVAADRVAVTVAESQVAGKLQTQRGLAQKPGVDIKGFPFLTQLAGGKLDDVRVHAVNMVVRGSSGNSVILQTFDADLKGVKLENDYSTAVADTATGTATVSYAELSIAIPSHPTFGYAGNGRVTVAATADVPGLGSKHFGATAKLVPAGNGTGIGLADISGITGLSGIPGVAGQLVSGLVGESLGLQLSLDGLPQGLTVSQVVPGPDGVSITVGGSGVSLNGGEA